MSAAESNVAAPEQRLMLERAYSAFHGASQSKAALLGKKTGVFIGTWAMEYSDALRQLTHPSARSGYAVTSATCSVLVGRISFVLGLQGPCVPYDTACSSSLVSTHAAWRAVERHECSAGLTGCVNMIL